MRFLNLQAGGRRFDPGHVHHPSTRNFNHSLILPLRDFRNLGPFGSNQKLLRSLDRLALLRWNRLQINLSRDLRRPEPGEYRAK